jgi:hypothetical protein
MNISLLRREMKTNLVTKGNKERSPNMTYSIMPNKGHYELYINGKLYCTADSMQEAESEIKAYAAERK